MNNTQTYKGNLYSRTKIKNNISKLYRLTDKTDRYDWYQDAYDFAESLSHDYGISINTSCGIIAALSPVKQWEQNKKCAISLLETGNGKHMKQFNDKALKILECNGSEECIKSILNGRKIISFYTNIRHPKDSDEVTIDRHALSVALSKWVKEEDYAGMTNKQYKFFQDCYKYTAKKIGISPVLLQSSTWERFRKIKQNYR
tara:strand:- start:1742 stop:2344 length:603 start_codon:yes stop_codon:yes gene_type:complete